MNLAAAAQSSIGRKLISGLTGLLLIGFVIGHLTGNFLLLVGPEAFNNYAYFLEHLFHGAGLYVAEVGLIILFASHAWSGYRVWDQKWKARPTKYVEPGDAGGKSKKSISSTSMLWTGCLLLLFVVWHVAQFKFGIVDTMDRTFTAADGRHMKDLYGLVIDTFANPLWTGLYLVVMAGLGVHLWHGAWSAFQSLGLANDSYLPRITLVANFLAVVLAIGFLFLPAYIMIDNANLKKKDQDYMRLYQGYESNGHVVAMRPSGAMMQSAEKAA